MTRYSEQNNSRKIVNNTQYDTARVDGWRRTAAIDVSDERTADVVDGADDTAHSTTKCSAKPGPHSRETRVAGARPNGVTQRFIRERRNDSAAGRTRQKSTIVVVKPTERDARTVRSGSGNALLSRHVNHVLSYELTGLKKSAKYRYEYALTRQNNTVITSRRRSVS